MSEMPLIAVIEDEEHLAQGLLFNLQAEGYRTHHEADGDTALEYLLKTNDRVDVVVLDGMLPGTDGFNIVRAMRKAEQYTPVLMLTARSRPEEVLEGLDAGADDYLPKPFDLGILLARIKSLLRRTAWHRNAAPPGSELEVPSAQPVEYSFNHRTIRFDLLELVAPNRTTQLTVMEADLLRYLTEREGQVVSRKEILDQVWRVHEDTDTRAIDNFIVRLRRYIEDDPANPQHLVTVRGIGYRFLANP
ncbi:MAG: response regulator transcription factor [Edaphobacter sp.]|uniref:response regulator transcription factor n=1 Tax=Edaphobacter sp. TaxID=1934404 RepID=UPI0023A097A5|nr:response regulator transcription factor [Edaphobacter sp.]MDE1175620.1 response regulator transcription factor [Edaphobacter sp.]